MNNGKGFFFCFSSTLRGWKPTTQAYTHRTLLPGWRLYEQAIGPSPGRFRHTEEVKGGKIGWAFSQRHKEREEVSDQASRCILTATARVKREQNYFISMAVSQSSCEMLHGRSFPKSSLTYVLWLCFWHAIHICKYMMRTCVTCD